ncbi:MAG TPA: prepilin-type N-terminal cleavage/methylation domain-containing protein [Actinomycetota bacterium]|nr:prepilin-type N-terminal cleavage/methylation domain-containing protein [Actinomycetota bacterium]
MTMKILATLRSDERGLTLTEVLVAMMVMSLAAGVFLSTLASVQKSVAETDIRTRSNTQARLAMQTLDREVRSGNILYDPESSTDPHFRFKVYTQANATTRQPSPGYSCRLWRITSSAELQTRSWEPGQADPNLTASNWRTVATGIVNKSVDDPVDSTCGDATCAFRLDDDPNKGGRTVNVVFLVNEDLNGDLSSGTVKIQSALTGRNTSYGFPTEVCEDEPVD